MTCKESAGGNLIRKVTRDMNRYLKRKKKDITANKHLDNVHPQ